MTELVTVRIEYTGHLSAVADRKHEFIDIKNEMSSVAHQVAEYLKNAYSMDGPVMLMVKGKNLISYTKEHEGESIEEGTCYTVIPVVSGG
ncbi:MAG: hypothetical protein A3J97_00045 [Spirochaetes bacterium RIFOXYC1_FULL_54_7]|nr:MAG: hypothetical protein A3J97_00045 [Spirochaetes bacterium RIFOXYC1_FULL_54_7]